MSQPKLAPVPDLSNDQVLSDLVGLIEAGRARLVERHPYTVNGRTMVRVVVLIDEQPAITCPRCGRTSYHPMDIKQKYCGACHWWTSDPVLGRICGQGLAGTGRGACGQEWPHGGPHGP